RAQQKDKVEGSVVEEDFLTRVVKATRGEMVGRVLLRSWVAGFGLQLLFRFLKPGRRSWALLLAVLALTVALRDSALLSAHVWAARTVREAVVLPKAMEVREFPKEGAKASFQIHEGLKVRVLEEAGRYVRIRLPNGLEGWTEREGVTEI